MKFRLTHPRSQATLPVQLQGKSLLVLLEMSDTTIRMVILNSDNCPVLKLRRYTR